MLQETEIVKLIKEAYEYKLPQWKLDYMSRIRTNLQVHTKGMLFSKVDTLHPNENPASKDHCVNTYEPITKGSIWKSINNITRIFSNSSFTVSASDSTLGFINSNYFKGQNLFSFFVSEWIEQAIATDPNALCVTYPQEYIDDHGVSFVNFISHEHIKHISDDKIVFISEHESEKTYSVEDSVIKKEVFYDPNIKSPNARRIVEKTYNYKTVCKIDEPVYNIFTKEYVVRFKVENGKDFTYDIYYYKKPLNDLQAFKLTSSGLILDICESFVSQFIPFGNLALLQHRNHRAVDLMFSYPRMSEIETKCEAMNCDDGVITTADGTNTSCGVCGGSGWVTPQSPYKVYKKRADMNLGSEEAIKIALQAKPVEFFTPETGILDYSKNSWKDYLSMAEEAVFIQQKSETGNIESAKAKQIDKEGEYSWTMNISKALNTDLKRVIQAYENYLNAAPTQVSLEQPISVALVTETEAFETLDTIISSDAPIYLKSQQVENFLHKFVSKSSPVVKAMKILKLIDPLIFYSNKDVQNFKSNNAVSVEAWVKHIYAYPLLMQLYEKDKTLFDQEDVAILNLVTVEIEKLVPKEADLKDMLKKVA